MTGITTIEDRPPWWSKHNACDKKPGAAQDPGSGNFSFSDLRSLHRSDQDCLVALQFDITTEALNPDFRTTVTGHIFQMTARAMFCPID